MQTIKRNLAALAALCAGALMAADMPFVNTFEDASDASVTNSWAFSGGVAFTNATPTSAPANGYAVSDAAHSQSLFLDGQAASLSFSTNAAIVVSDFMLEVALPDETPTVDDTLVSGSALAIAVDTNGTLIAFTNATGSAITLDSTKHADGDWLRITLLFNLTNSQCCVAVDGTIVNGGEWFDLPESLTAISGITVTTSCMDDVVVREQSSDVYDAYASVTTSGEEVLVASDVKDASGAIVSVPTNYFTVYRIDAANVNANVGATGLTVAQAYLAGVDPTNGVFAVTGAEMTSESVTLTFPGSWPAGSYVVKFGSSLDCDTAATSSSAEKDGSSNKVTIPLSFDSSKVLYYKVTR